MNRKPSYNVFNIIAGILWTVIFVLIMKSVIDYVELQKEYREYFSGGGYIWDIILYSVIAFVILVNVIGYFSGSVKCSFAGAILAFLAYLTLIGMVCYSIINLQLIGVFEDALGLFGLVVFFIEILGVPAAWLTQIIITAKAKNGTSIKKSWFATTLVYSIDVVMAIILTVSTASKMDVGFSYGSLDFSVTGVLTMGLWLSAYLTSGLALYMGQTGACALSSGSNYNQTNQNYQQNYNPNNQNYQQNYAGYNQMNNYQQNYNPNGQQMYNQNNQSYQQNYAGYNQMNNYQQNYNQNNQNYQQNNNQNDD